MADMTCKQCDPRITYKNSDPRGKKQGIVCETCPQLSRKVSVMSSFSHAQLTIRLRCHSLPHLSTSPPFRHKHHTAAGCSAACAVLALACIRGPKASRALSCPSQNLDIMYSFIVATWFWLSQPASCNRLGSFWTSAKPSPRNWQPA